MRSATAMTMRRCGKRCARTTRLLKPEVRERLSHSQGIGPDMRAVVRQMGRDGWLGIGWPPEYGGQGRTPIEQFVFFDESMRAQAPVPMLTVNTVGPTIMHFGTAAQKQFFLPRSSPEIHSASAIQSPARAPISPPSDASCQSGDEYIINGQKIWTSLASDADTVVGGAHQPRSQEAQGHLDDHRRHENTDGITVRPSNSWRITRVRSLLDDLRVPVANRVGEETAVGTSSPISSITNGSRCFRRA